MHSGELSNVSWEIFDGRENSHTNFLPHGRDKLLDSSESYKSNSEKSLKNQTEMSPQELFTQNIERTIDLGQILHITSDAIHGP